MTANGKRNQRTVRVTPGNLRNGSFPLSGALDLFPRDCIGGPSRGKGEGRRLTLEVQGLAESIETDIPTYKTSGRPRPLFRERAWTKKFFKRNGIRAGDTIVITQVGARRYSLEPENARNIRVSGQLPLFGRTARAVAGQSPVRTFRFIDLFCGIGGFRIAFERAGAKCVFSCDWDRFSQQTYEANFGEKPHGDINSIPVANIPQDPLAYASPN